MNWVHLVHFKLVYFIYEKNEQGAHTKALLSALFTSTPQPLFKLCRRHSVLFLETLVEV